MAAQTTRFRARTIRASSLDLLTQLVRGRAPDGRDEDWGELVEAGFCTAERTLRPRWAQVLGEASRAPVGLRVDSRLGRAGMSSTLALTPGIGLSVTERRRLRVTDAHVEIEAVEDAVEIALFDPRLVWPAVQRVLPPSAAVRAEGSAATATDERTVGVIAEVPERTALPESVLAALAGADVEVNLALRVDNGTSTPFVTSRHWLEADDRRLLEVRLLRDAVTVVDVPHGTVADEVAWLAVGAFDLRRRVGQTAS